VQSMEIRSSWKETDLVAGLQSGYWALTLRKPMTPESRFSALARKLRISRGHGQQVVFLSVLSLRPMMSLIGTGALWHTYTSIGTGVTWESHCYVVGSRMCMYFVGEISSSSLSTAWLNSKRRFGR